MNNSESQYFDNCAIDLFLEEDLDNQNTLNKENENGFFINESGVYRRIINYVLVLGICKDTIASKIKKSNIKPIQGLDKRGKIRDFYLEDDIKILFSDFSDLPKADQDGYIEIDNKKFTTIKQISDNLKIGYDSIALRIKKHKINSIKGLSLLNRPLEFYNEEQIIELMSDLLSPDYILDNNSFIEIDGIKYGSREMWSKEYETTYGNSKFNEVIKSKYIVKNLKGGLYSIYSQNEVEKVFGVLKKKPVNINKDLKINKLIEENKNLVFSIYYKKFRNYEHIKDDLIQEGLISIMICEKKFNPNMGVAFSTYLYSSIYRRMRKYIENKNSTINLTSHIFENINKINSFIKNYQNKNNKKPTIKEISIGLKLSERIVNQAIEGYKVSNITSLDQRIKKSDEIDINYYDLIECIKYSPDKNDEINHTAKIISECKSIILNSRFCLRNGTEKTWDIFLSRIGLDENGEHCEIKTLKELAKKHNLGHERIRQIEEIIISEIRVKLKRFFPKKMTA